MTIRLTGNRTRIVRTNYPRKRKSGSKAEKRRPINKSWKIKKVEKEEKTTLRRVLKGILLTPPLVRFRGRFFFWGGGGGDGQNFITDFKKPCYMTCVLQVTRKVYNLFQWPVEKDHYFGGWVEGANTFGSKTLQTDKHTELVVPEAKKLGTKVCKIQQTDRQNWQRFTPLYTCKDWQIGRWKDRLICAGFSQVSPNHYNSNLLCTSTRAAEPFIYIITNLKVFKIKHHLPRHLY